MVRAGHCFKFRVVINGNTYQMATSGKNKHAEGAKNSHFWHLLHVFPQPSSRVLRDSTHAVQVGWILIHKGYYHVFVKYRNSDLPTLAINSNYAMLPYQWSVNDGGQVRVKGIIKLLPNLRTAQYLSDRYCLTYPVCFTLLRWVIMSCVDWCFYSCCYFCHYLLFMPTMI